MANLAFFVVSGGPGSQCVTYFSHSHVYNACLHYPMPIRAIDSVCPQAILSMSVTLFTSGTLCVTNIPSINCNYTLCCSELNGENAGEGFRSLQLIVFEIYASKIEILSIFRKLDL